MASEADQLLEVVFKLTKEVDDAATKINDLVSELIALVPTHVHPNHGVTLVHIDDVIDDLQKACIQYKEVAFSYT